MCEIATLSALLGRRAALGYLLACPLLGIIVLLGPTFIARTSSQLDAGVELTTAELIGPLGGFSTTALRAIWTMASLLRRVRGEPAGPEQGMAADPASWLQVSR